MLPQLRIVQNILRGIIPLLFREPIAFQLLQHEESETQKGTVVFQSPSPNATKQQSVDARRDNEYHSADIAITCIYEQVGFRAENQRHNAQEEVVDRFAASSKYMNVVQQELVVLI